MSKPSDANEHELEEIIAYLDGELSAEESARVERRLAEDEQYRRQVHSAELVWAALDELPQATVDDRFSRTTIEMAAATAAAPEIGAAVFPPQKSSRRTSWPWRTILASAAAAALGFLLVRVALRNPNRILLDDLPVIAGVNMYSQFPNAAFLRELQTRTGDLLVSHAAKEQIAADAAAMAAVEDPDGRAAWIQNLPPDGKSDFLARYNRFRELSKAEQDRLRAIHAEIAAAPDAAQLRQTMVAYQNWLGNLSADEQYDLRMIPADQRVGEVAESAARLKDEAVFTLTPEELKSFAKQVRQPFDELRRRLYALRDQGARHGPNRGPDRGPGGPERGGRRNPPWGYGFGGPRQFGISQLAASAENQAEFTRAVVAALPERSRASFESLPPLQKIQRVFGWMRQASALEGQVSQSELEEFFAEELDVKTREELLSLSARQMDERLRTLYRQQVGGHFDDWNPDFNGPGGPGGFGGRRAPGGGPWGPGRGRGEGPPPGGERGAGRPGEFGPPPDGFGPPGDFGPPRDKGGFDGPRGAERELPPPVPQ